MSVLSDNQEFLLLSKICCLLDSLELDLCNFSLHFNNHPRIRNILRARDFANNLNDFSHSLVEIKEFLSSWAVVKSFKIIGGRFEYCNKKHSTRGS